MQSQFYPPYQGPPVSSGPVMPGAPMPGVPGQPMPQHGKRRRRWGLIITIIILVLLLIGTMIFALWAFMSMQDYKDNSDKKSAKAVAIAVQLEGSKKDKEFAEKDKYPFKSYLGPETYGGINLEYPKTWSAAITQNDKLTTPIDGFFYPNFVPGAQSGTNYALRIQVSSQSYDQEMKAFESKAKSGKVTVSPAVLPNVPGVNGSLVVGEINVGQKNSMVLLPLRDKTIKVWTESPEFFNDFSVVLEKLKFTP